MTTENVNSIQRTEKKEDPKPPEAPKSLVTNEDLLFELGRQVAERINKDKIINQLSKTITDYETQFKFIQAATEKRIKSLEEEVAKYKGMIKEQIGEENVESTKAITEA